jgi:hypothetical protein
MRAKKRYLYLTGTEWRVVLLALNRMRSMLISQSRYTDAVDEIIMIMAGYGGKMEKFKTDMETGLQYEPQGDYYVIAGEVESERPSVSIWGWRHLRWLKQTAA